MNTAMDKPTDVEPVATTYEKKKSKAKLPISKGKVINPLSKGGITKSKELQRAQVQVKKEKAINARKKHQQRVLATIDLNSSESEEDSNDDVIPIELPPPPFINLDTSDEEDLAHQVRKVSRPVSPSNSSIVSDDFIVTGDKSRLIDAFRIEAMNVRGSANKNRQNKESAVKLKSILKQSSTSFESISNNSPRGSVASVTETSNKEQIPDTSIKTKSYSKERRSFEDSIYTTKASTSTPKRSQAASNGETSEDESCIAAKKQKLRRRKSTGSRSAGKSSENEESDVDMNQKLISSTPIGKGPAKRSRFISSNYNDDEFASMISSIIRQEDSNEGEEESSEERSTANTTITEANTVINISKSRVIEETDDCRIIEKPIPVLEIPDDEDSDSDASMKADRTPVVCDLSLNVLENTFEPHELVKDAHPSSSSNIDCPIDVLEDPEVGWNDEMRYFYNRSWGGEDFFIGEMLNSMSSK